MCVSPLVSFRQLTQLKDPHKWTEMSVHAKDV
jgi:hypothetical protein